MKIGKGEIILNFIQYFISIPISLFVIKIILSKISIEEYAIWNVFLSIQTFINLLDAGFGPSIVIYSSYAVAGVEKITEFGIPKIKRGTRINYKLIFYICECAKTIHRKITVISFIFLLFLTIYIWYLSYTLSNINLILIYWLLFVFTLSIDIYYTYLNNIIKGMGKIREATIIQIIGLTIDNIIKIFLLLCNFGLLSLIISYFIKIITTKILIYKFLKKDFNLINKNKINKNELDDLYKIIVKNSKQFSFFAISNFLIEKGRILIFSLFLPLSVIGKFSLTSQIIGIIYSVSLLPYSVFKYKFGVVISQNKNEECKNIFSMILLLFVTLMILGISLFLLYEDLLFKIIKFQVNLLDKDLIILFWCYQLILGVIKISTGHIQFYNIYIYIKSIIITNFIFTILAAIFMSFGKGLKGYILIMIIGQCVYNFWKWLRFSCFLLKMPIKEIFKRGIKHIFYISKQKI